MRITKHKIKEVRRLSDAHESAKELSSEFLRTAQDRHSNEPIVVPAGEGRDVETEMTEKEAWTEVYQLGPGCNAGKELQKRHAKVFEQFKKADAIGNEYHEYVRENFGVDFRNMEFRDIMDMQILLIDQRMNEHLGVKSKEDETE